MVPGLVCRGFCLGSALCGSVEITAPFLTESRAQERSSAFSSFAELPPSFCPWPPRSPPSPGHRAGRRGSRGRSSPALVLLDFSVLVLTFDSTPAPQRPLCHWKQRSLDSPPRPEAGSLLRVFPRLTLSAMQLREKAGVSKLRGKCHLPPELLPVSHTWPGWVSPTPLLRPPPLPTGPLVPEFQQGTCSLSWLFTQALGLQHVVTKLTHP